MPSSRGSSQSRGWTQVSCIAGGFFTSWATREAPIVSKSRFKQLLIREGRGYRNRGTIKWWYSLETGFWFLLKKKKKKMHSNVFEFFYRTGTHTQVEDGNFRLNTRLLEHCSVASPPTNQKKSHTLQPSPQMSPSVSGGMVMTICLGLLFGPISSLTGTNSFKLNCFYYKGECWFHAKNTST